VKFNVNKTYTQVTPESAEHGDYSDTGFEFQDQQYTLRELINYIKQNGFVREANTDWLTTGYWTQCHYTGTEKCFDLHITLIKGK